MKNYYEGRLQREQRLVTDMEDEEQARIHALQEMRSVDEYHKALNESYIRREDKGPDWECAMMAGEDTNSSKVAALAKAEQAIVHLAELDKLNADADKADSSLQPPNVPAVHHNDVRDVVDKLVQAKIESISANPDAETPELLEKEKKALEETKWKHVESLLERRENEAKMKGRVRHYAQTGKYAPADSAEAVAAEIEADARDSQDKLDQMMAEMMANFDMKPEDTNKAPAHRYHDKYDYKYKHNKLETMSIH
jgi:hypothetical protein